MFVRTVAAEVKGHGEEYAKSLRERERTNPKYAFLKPGVSFLACVYVQNSDYLKHRRYKYYINLVRREKSIEPEFDDEVRPSTCDVSPIADCLMHQGVQLCLLYRFGGRV